MPNYSGRAIAVTTEGVQVPVIVQIRRQQIGLRADSLADLWVAPGVDDTPLLNAAELLIRVPGGAEEPFLAVDGQRIPGQLRLRLIAAG